MSESYGCLKCVGLFLLVILIAKGYSNPNSVVGAQDTDYDKGCSNVQCERGAVCVQRKFSCKNPPCPHMLFCAKNRREFVKGPTTCDYVHCSPEHACVVKVHGCHWDKRCKQQIVRCISHKENQNGFTSCAGVKCPIGNHCILTESLCTHPPCKLVESCAAEKDVQIWFNQCRHLGCPSEFECFLRKPDKSCKESSCTYVPDCTTTIAREVTNEYCRGWICPAHETCHAEIVEDCTTENCNIKRTCQNDKVDTSLSSISSPSYGRRSLEPGHEERNTQITKFQEFPFATTATEKSTTSSTNLALNLWLNCLAARLNLDSIEVWIENVTLQGDLKETILKDALTLCTEISFTEHPPAADMGNQRDGDREKALKENRFSRIILISHLSEMLKRKEGHKCLFMLTNLKDYDINSGCMLQLNDVFKFEDDEVTWEKVIDSLWKFLLKFVQQVKNPKLEDFLKYLKDEELNLNNYLNINNSEHWKQNDQNTVPMFDETQGETEDQIPETVFSDSEYSDHSHANCSKGSNFHKEDSTNVHTANPVHLAHQILGYGPNMVFKDLDEDSNAEGSWIKDRHVAEEISRNEMSITSKHNDPNITNSGNNNWLDESLVLQNSQHLLTDNGNNGYSHPRQKLNAEKVVNNSLPIGNSTNAGNMEKLTGNSNASSQARDLTLDDRFKNRSYKSLAAENVEAGDISNMNPQMIIPFLKSVIEALNDGYESLTDNETKSYIDAENKLFRENNNTDNNNNASLYNTLQTLKNSANEASKLINSYQESSETNMINNNKRSQSDQRVSNSQSGKVSKDITPNL